MAMPRITDWDDAYANAPHIPGGDGFPAAWAQSARRYRERLAAAARARLDIVYGPHPRNRLDLFLPAGAPKGLVGFVHGGYWRGLAPVALGRGCGVRAGGR